MRQVERQVRIKLVVLQHMLDPDPAHRRAAAELLDLTLCGKKKFTRLREDLLSHLVGDWTSPVIKYACRRPGCCGGDGCTAAAASHAMFLMIQTVFARRVWL